MKMTISTTENQRCQTYFSSRGIYTTCIKKRSFLDAPVFSASALHCVEEVVREQMRLYSTDLRQFSSHARRSTITADDVGTLSWRVRYKYSTPSLTLHSVTLYSVIFFTSCEQNMDVSLVGCVFTPALAKKLTTVFRSHGGMEW